MRRRRHHYLPPLGIRGGQTHGGAFGRLRARHQPARGAMGHWDGSRGHRDENAHWLRPPGTRHHLTDSKYAKGCLGEDWDAKGANAPLVAGLQALLAASPVTWTIEWIPGHADVAGNDAADAAAVRGVTRSAASRGLTELDARIVNKNDLP